MLFVHPNPLDGSCWLYQTAHFSTWFRCVAVDLPGYGTSPASLPGLTLEGLADACWDAVDRGGGGSPSVLVGCSVGSSVVQHMYHRRPDATAALVVTGTGYRPVKEFAARRAQAFRDEGLAYRARYARDCMAPDFAATRLADWLVSMVTERNGSADLPSIQRLFAAMAGPDPSWLHEDLRAPVLILTGSLDRSHASAYALRDRLPDARLVVLEGGGHLAFLEQPWAFDRHVARFLSDTDLVPA
jgi:3-oxoadipate enol-lactonase